MSREKKKFAVPKIDDVNTLGEKCLQRSSELMMIARVKNDRILTYRLLPCTMNTDLHEMIKYSHR